MEKQTKTEPLPIKADVKNHETPQELSSKTKLLARLPKSQNLKNVIQNNNNDIISMVQAADEAVKSIGNITEAIKGKLVSGNGSNDAPSIQEMAREANKIVHETLFDNSIKLLNGSFGFRTIKIGKDAKDTITFSMPDLRKWAEKLQKIDSKSNKEEALTTVESLLARVTSERSKLSTLLDRLFNACYTQKNVVEQKGTRPPMKTLWS